MGNVTNWNTSEVEIEAAVIHNEENWLDSWSEEDDEMIATVTEEMKELGLDPDDSDDLNTYWYLISQNVVE